MSTPKYGRRKVRIDPRLVVPPGIVDVEIDSDKTVTAAPPTSTNNGYNGVIRDDRPTQIKPTDPRPVTSGTNPWGVAKLVSQVVVVNSDGEAVVEVTFELPDWPGGTEARVVRV